MCVAFSAGGEGLWDSDGNISVDGHSSGHGKAFFISPAGDARCCFARVVQVNLI